LTHPPDHSAYGYFHKPTVEELEERARRQRIYDAHPNVHPFEEGKDRTERQWGMKNLKTGKVLILTEEQKDEWNPYFEKVPEGYQVVGRTLWPEPWEPIK
jgi:fido (protein-threonine AMPylation protein)